MLMSPRAGSPRVPAGLPRECDQTPTTTHDDNCNKLSDSNPVAALMATVWSRNSRLTRTDLAAHRNPVDPASRTVSIHAPHLAETRKPAAWRLVQNAWHGLAVFAGESGRQTPRGLPVRRQRGFCNRICRALARHAG